MKNINIVVISGNLTRDAEVRSSSSTEVVRFTVAVNGRQRNSGGEWEDRPNYIDCTAFGERFSNLAPNLTKGTKVTVKGELRWNQWEADGKKHSKVEVVPEQVEYMSRKEPKQESLYDEDVPF